MICIQSGDLYQLKHEGIEERVNIECKSKYQSCSGPGEVPQLLVRKSGTIFVGTNLKFSR